MFRSECCHLRWILSHLFAVVFLLFAGLGFGSAEPNQELAVYDGDWSQLDSEQDRAARIEAIEDAIDDLSWVLRTMAGPMLRNTTAPPPRMQFVWDGQHLEQHIFEPEGPRVRTIELGRESKDGRDAQGETLDATWHWTGDALRLNWAQHQAHGYNIYRVDPSTGTLIVKHMIQITAVSDVGPIVYESRFERQGLPTVAADRPSDRSADRASAEAGLASSNAPGSD